MKKAGLPAFLFFPDTNMSGGINPSKNKMFGNVRSYRASISQLLSFLYFEN